METLVRFKDEGKIGGIGFFGNRTVIAAPRPCGASGDGGTK